MNWLRSHWNQMIRLGIGAGVLGAVLLSVTFVSLYRQRKATEAMIASRYETSQSESGTESAIDGGEGRAEEQLLLAQDTVEWNGKTYRYNSYMRAILCIGVDRRDSLTEIKRPGTAGQADGLLLAAWDTARSQMKILLIPRDCMTYLTPVNRDGTIREEEYDHITLAFSYGDGAEKSCENTVSEVSGMMFGFPIDHYLTVDTVAIRLLNDAVGGVTVTVPAGLESVDPAFAPGSQIILQGDQAERFVRYRDITEDHSALYRMFRGREYITGFFQAAQRTAEKDSQTVPKLFTLVEDHMITDMGKEMYMGMAADALASQSLTAEDFYVVPGSAVVTETYDEYHVDEGGLVQVLLDLFYREI